MSEPSNLRIAVEGCGHGTLHAIYASVEKSCQIHGWSTVDLLIIGGDFQAVRNSYDLNAMSVPPKYRAIGDFHEYYSGARLAPCLTLFVGGNHEASNHLWELYYGGWVAPRIYYLGAANVVNFGPLRIAGLSGIWSGPDYRKPHSERLPYDFKELKSIYHQRELDVRKLLQLRTQVDVGISHDWPRKVEWQGDYQQLFRFKPHFESDATTGRLGSPAARYVMDRLRPKWWFAAHLHCKFSAVVDHDRETDTTSGEKPEILHSTEAIKLESKIGQSPEEETLTSPANVHNDDEIDLDMEDDEPCAAQPAMVQSAANSASQEDFTESNGVPIDLRAQLPASFARPTPAGAAAAPSMAHPRAIGNDRTHFLALDKCLPNRRFLQMLEIDPISNSSATARDAPYRFTYDKEWLAITRAFAAINPLTSPIPPDEGESHYRTLIETEEAWIEKNLAEADKMVIPENFEMTAPIYDPSVGLHPSEHPREYTNPQTVAFCKLLGIVNFFDYSEEDREERRSKAPPADSNSSGGRGGGGGRSRGRGFGGRGRGRGRGRGYR
ncbi:MAG: hypothetical protein L6R36_005477 [Xanthoria steineri]|nr:MAG: hypothetical protein L6R36_005477 [Xanthoria steineri]